MTTSRRNVLTLGALTALGLSACGSGGDDPLSTSSTTSGAGSSSGGSGEEIVVGSADFGESILLAEIYAGALRAKGMSASTKPNIGAREIYLKALEEGSVHVVPEYTGALALYYDKKFSETDPEKVYSALEGVLPEGLTVLERSAAEDKDAVVLTRKTADAQGLKTLDDLAAKAGELTVAGPAEFKSRVQGLPGLKSKYGIEFKSFRPLKPGQATVQALKNGQVDAANIFTTDPSIAANDLVALEDPKQLFGSQNVVPLVRTEVKDQVADTLDAVSAKLSTEKLSEMLSQTEIDKKDYKDVAEAFLKENGLA